MQATAFTGSPVLAALAAASVAECESAAREGRSEGHSGAVLEWVPVELAEGNGLGAEVAQSDRISSSAPSEQEHVMV
jgi:hypothetical protein